MTRARIAATALRFRGVPYRWGGGGPPSAGWDCSGFVSWVLGKVLGFALPGGFTDFGNAHGPVVSDYIGWGGAVDVASPQAGDLCCWGPDEHIGIAISPTMMISALNPQLGTLVTPIGGAAPGQLVFRRVTGAGGGTPAPAAAGAAAPSGAGAVLLRLAAVAGLAAAAVVVVVAGVAFLTSGAGLAALAGASGRKTRGSF